jgi:hypothetical protein
MDKFFKKSKNADNAHSTSNMNANSNNTSFNNQGNPESNLKSKLNNAFSDLESLTSTLKNIRKTSDNSQANNDSNSRNKPGNNEKVNFFTDDKYKKTVDQTKQTTNDKKGGLLNKLIPNSKDSKNKDEGEKCIDFFLVN